MIIKCACFAAAILSTGCFKQATPTMSRIEFSFAADDLDKSASGARPKTIYLAGEGSSRIEQYADATSDIKNLIVVHEPDIWLIDGTHKIAGHSVNHGPDLTVHNPILGPDGPEELLSLEWGHEDDFFAKARTQSLPREKVGEIPCDVRQVRADNYEVRLYSDSGRKVPVELRAFKDGERLFVAHYD